MVGAMIGHPSTALWSTVRAKPSEMTPMSLLVPPMSMVATSRKLMRFAMNWAPTTPPAGPDITVRTGSDRAVRLAMTPPFDCITKSSRPRPRSLSACDRPSK